MSIDISDKQKKWGVIGGAIFAILVAFGSGYRLGEIGTISAPYIAYAVDSWGALPKAQRLEMRREVNGLTKHCDIIITCDFNSDFNKID